ncbi:hypothetical protein EYF80_067005 [Liparis tanakae]|uniref:Uncharacterized protein n=1 Tax=Liparis tanakae TaxID=230148 RepID=A0A4Z2E287_9TELE|nr:hypothetical protein EYF80_067005 [Liparis tanakae]
MHGRTPDSGRPTRGSHPPPVPRHIVARAAERRATSDGSGVPTGSAGPKSRAAPASQTRPSSPFLGLVPRKQCGNSA